MASAADAKWSQKTLKCNLGTLIHKPSRDEFLAELAAAPCLGTLSLKLAKRFGDFFDKELSQLPKAVVQALMKAPAKTRKLSLELEFYSGDLLFALLERTKGHLKELECTAFPRLSDADLRRFWSLLVGSSVEAVKLAPESLRDVGFPFETGAWPALQRLDFFQRPLTLDPPRWGMCGGNLAPKPYPPVLPGLLTPLIRVNATATAVVTATANATAGGTANASASVTVTVNPPTTNSTSEASATANGTAEATVSATGGLCVVGLPWQMAPTVRQAVYQALAACPALEELSSPCYRELALVSACARVSSLRLVGNLVGVSERKEAAEDVGGLEAAGCLLRNPAVAARLKSLTLRNFQLDYQDGDYIDGRVDSDEEMDDDEEGFFTEHILGMKKLQSLTLEKCQGVGGALGKILPQLEGLRELRLIRCRFLETALVTKYLTPENAPSLQVLEVNWEMMEYHEKSDLAEWRRAMKLTRRRFRSVCPDFLIRDASTFDGEGEEKEDDDEDAEEDEDEEDSEEQGDDFCDWDF